MVVLGSETRPLLTEMDIVLARQAVRARAIELGFKLVDQTKIVTASSELARNTVTYGGGGTLTLTSLSDDNGKKGLQLLFEDHGPGIADVQAALRDGFTTGSGLGMGLGGSKRLVSEFHIETQVGTGTRITATKWV